MYQSFSRLVTLSLVLIAWVRELGTVYHVIFVVINFHVLHKFDFREKIIFANDPCGHI